ncbi:MAG: VWA domain-containing protein [Devosiaceae bacterium]|nr:VWA domain-containing protein [Devosiaceae bacterium]
MDEKRLKSLSDIKIPDAGSDARQKALALAMEEYDGEFDHKIAGAEEKNKNNSTATKGTDDGERPISTINWIKGFITMKAPMNARFPIAATLTGLLVLPLGWVLYQNTALTPITFGARTNVETAVVEQPNPISVTDSGPVTNPAPVSTPVAEQELVFGNDARQERSDENISSLASEAIAPPQNIVQQDLGVNRAQMQEKVADGFAAPASISPLPVGGLIAPAPPVDQFSDADRARLQQIQTNNDRFAAFEEGAIKSVAEEPVSTFSIDVDTASYAYIRRALNEGRLPDPQAVRIEEMVNYFSYDYATPQNLDNPFAPQMEITPSPWNVANQLLRIGIEGYVPPASERQPVNLVFLIDTSGSMSSPDKLPLLQKAFALAVNQLNENDQVSIVTYAGAAGMVLAPTPASDKATILAALNNLHPGGSTAGAAGIELAYALAEQASVEGSVNRVLLATDGDFNVGISSETELKRFIETKRQSGTFLSVLGFGTGNLNDALMQTLAQNGNGSAYYIDSFSEAQKVMVEEIGSTLTTIAKDVKIQIEFNPALIAQYRLIGYETRALNREDFNNDKVDAGEIGAGHSVTALYELTPVGAENSLIDPLRYGETVVLDGGEVGVSASNTGVSNPNEIGFFKLRYKEPDGDVSKLIEVPITRDMVQQNMADASIDTRFAIAVAAFGQKLRGSVYGGDMSYADIKTLAAGARGDDQFGYRAEFIRLIDLAAAISGDK